jgi:hypothetical protein
MPGARSQSVLFMPLEFPRWEQGKPQSYTAQFGLEEGLLANGASTFVVPAMAPSPGGEACWQNHAPALAAGRSFDQAWLGLVHGRYQPGFCAWLAERVPVRVGLLFESMSCTLEECEQLPALGGRQAHVLRQARALGLTHALCGDERDVAVLEAAGVRAVWFPSAVPERFVGRDYRPPSSNRAAFFGSLYSEERRRLAALPGLQNLLALPQGPEAGTGLPAAFDALHAWTAQGPPEALHGEYVERLRLLRREIFTAWMGGLGQWNGLVNLPSYFKGYPGRVVEAMAANVPVVSWAIPERPRARALFEDGREILLFRRESPGQLVEQLGRLRSDLGFGRRLLEAARQKVLTLHTSETRVRQVLRWIEQGREPDYGC